MPSSKNDLESIGLKVANHVTAMLAYWDKNLVCRFANAAYRDWFGKTSEEMIDKMTIRELLGPLYDKNLPYITGALEGKPQTFEREIPTPSGGLRQSLANYFPDVVNGEVKGFFVHVADITPIKLLERELVRSSEMVRNQNDRLLNFSNIVSHNLKSYANNLKAILGMLLKSRSDTERQMLITHLQSISKGFSDTVNHLNQIVEIQNKSLQVEQVNLHDYVEQIIRVLGIQIETSKAIVRNNVDAGLTVNANPAYLESILLNLLSNAIKYKHPTRLLTVDVDAILKTDEIELSVCDNGLGINLKKHGKDIFGLYKTFHEHADAKGVGLFITKMQVEAMGGTIEVNSEENKGTRFNIRFRRNATN